MVDDLYGGAVEAYVLGALDGAEREGFEVHLAGCPSCQEQLRGHDALLRRLAAEVPPVPPAPHLRAEALDLARAPLPPYDPSAYSWDEVCPGVRVHLLHEDAERGMRACLVWADPGASHPAHRHLGAENILVLKGALRDHRGVYGPGQVCRSREGSIHSEEALPGDDCICYVVYYGDIEPL